MAREDETTMFTTVVLVLSLRSNGVKQKLHLLKNQSLAEYAGKLHATALTLAKLVQFKSSTETQWVEMNQLLVSWAAQKQR